ncbi:MAG: ketol-acid reductoisomerase [Thermoplasmata archaeon]|nr:ketol-acid reductoisomerase [Candidatus Sysuiplasma acidicola]
MVNAYYDKDADMGVLKGKRVAVIGYGIQGRAQALNLRDSGVDVTVGLRKSGDSWKIAESDGFAPVTVPDAVKSADIVMMLIPDEVQSDVYANDIAKHLKNGMTLEFGHGFNIHFRRIVPPEGVDVIMVAPKGPGAMVRNTYLQGFGTPSLVAVEKDYSGNAFNVALAIARGIGSTRAGVIRTTFREETETDNFGEQVVLCGGVAELIGKAFKLLVSSGYQPEVAYFEVLHELKLIVDLIQTGGIENMWDNVSNTAEYGGRTRGSRVIDDHVVGNMEKILSEIRDGSFAEEWMNEYYREMPTLRKKRDEAQKEHIEEVGRELRSLFVKKNSE